MIKSLNWVDVLVIIIVVRVGYVAFQEGLSHQIFPLLGSILTVIISLSYYNKIGHFISQGLIKIPVEISNSLSFLLLAVITALVFRYLKAIVDKVIHVEWHPLLEKFGGIVFGLGRAVILASLVLMIISLMPFPYLQRSIRDRSVTGMRFLEIGPELYGMASKLAPQPKTKEAVLTKEEIMKNLTADKTISPKVEAKKKVADWEKVGQ